VKFKIKVQKQDITGSMMEAKEADEFENEKTVRGTARSSDESNSASGEARLSWFVEIELPLIKLHNS
jgi:hypothetical protein